MFRIERSYLLLITPLMLTGCRAEARQDECAAFSLLHQKARSGFKELPGHYDPVRGETRLAFSTAGATRCMADINGASVTCRNLFANTVERNVGKRQVLEVALRCLLPSETSLRKLEHIPLDAKQYLRVYVQDMPNNLDFTLNLRVEEE